MLTFMYEEDRQTAMSMYAALFDSVSDEQALSQMLISPTRQAVVLARAYNSTERKLSIESPVKDEEEEGIPDFVIAIDRLYQEADAKGLIVSEEGGSTVLENQVSLFDEGLMDFEAAETAVETVLAESETEEIPAEETGAEHDESPADAEEELPAEGEEAPAAEAEAEAEAPAEIKPADSVMDEVDAFLASFSIDALDEKPEESAEKAAETVEEPTAEPVEAAAEAAATVFTSGVEEAYEQFRDLNPQTVRKPKVFLLILYVLFAIPVTAAGVALLLIPTILVLALAAVVIVLGVAALIAAFSGFAVIADILIVLGAALILLAVGLLLLWLFVWFIGGAIVGLIHAVVSLGGKWCYKEVAA